MLARWPRTVSCKLCRRASTTPRPPAHTSLASFLHYADELPLDRLSTVFRGTLYEYSVLDCLRHHGFDVYRTGGADDRGIDLRGHWRLPRLPRTKTRSVAADGPDESSSPARQRAPRTRDIPVVIQCKHEVKKMGPRVVREVGGIRTAAASPIDTDADISEASHVTETLRVLASSSAFTEKAIQAMMTSTAPLLLCLISAPESISNDLPAVPSKRTSRAQAKLDLAEAERQTRGTLKQVIWNLAAAKIIGQELTVRLVHAPAKSESAASGTGSTEPVLKLYFDGKTLGATVC